MPENKLKGYSIILAIIAPIYLMNLSSKASKIMKRILFFAWNMYYMKTKKNEAELIFVAECTYM